MNGCYVSQMGVEGGKCSRCCGEDNPDEDF